MTHLRHTNVAAAALEEAVCLGQDVQANSSTSARRLLDRLEAVRSTGRGQWIALCPAHEDHSPSLSVRELDDGRVLIHDFAGCAVADVVGAVGLELAHLFPDRPTDHRGRPVPIRDRWDWRGLLRLLNREARVVAMAANDVAGGRTLSAEDRERVRVAQSRIERVAEVA